MKQYSFLLLVLGTAVLGLGLGACSVIAPAPTPTPTLTPVPPTPTPDQSAYWADWESSIHADTYALEKGPNTYCARCHSPANWDPAAVIDDPPNCVSCKFPHEEEPRIAEGNPLVPEEEWENINCETCHQMTNGIVQEGICWRDVTSGYCETVASSTQLCGKCHRNTETLRHQRAIAEGGAHAELECVSCHNPHSLEAKNCRSCHQVEMQEVDMTGDMHAGVTSNDQCLECHPDAWAGHNMKVKQSGSQDCINCHDDLVADMVLEPVMRGHNQVHEQVPCAVCHDASGMKVGQSEETGEWLLLRQTELLGRTSEEPYTSHAIQREVDCTRCHYPENPWDLPENVSK